MTFAGTSSAVEMNRMDLDRIVEENHRKEIQMLIQLAKMVHLPQKTVGIALQLYHISKRDLRIEPDDVVLHCACLNLACKISDLRFAISKIFTAAIEQLDMDVDGNIVSLYIDSIHKTEADICLIIDFDFNMADVYETLERICEEHLLPARYRKVCWILLNDSLQIRIIIDIPVEKLIYACIFIQFISEKDDKNYKDDITLAKDYIEWLNITNITADELIDIGHRVMSLY